jgi:hypothetical protein
MKEMRKMGRFNTKGAVLSRAGVKSPVKTRTTPTLRTHEGAPAFERDTRGEAFTLGVSYLVGENTFYESAADRAKRFNALIAACAINDPTWTVGFLGYLRNEAYIRTASIQGAMEGIHARLCDADSVKDDARYNMAGYNRLMADIVCQRADEPGEALSYWLSNYGKPLPMPLKRGLGDAARRLWNEYTFLKYDTKSHGVSFGDFIELTHVKPSDDRQSALFSLAVAQAHGNTDDNAVAIWLTMVHAQRVLRGAAEVDAKVLLNTEHLKTAGMTWEDALSLAGSRVPKKKLWEAMIPSMGYMALLRNLRNFDEAGISQQFIEMVAARLSDPGEVAKSKQFPYRFLSAFENVHSLNWGPALEAGLKYSLANIPELKGSTDVLVDTSASMGGAMSSKSSMSYAKAAAVFGTALAVKNPGKVRLIGFANGTFEHSVPKGSSVLVASDKFIRRIGEVGHGTEISQSIRTTYNGADRVVIITDEQAFADSQYGYQYGRGFDSYAKQTPVTDSIPADKWLYGFNIGGYKPSMMESGKGKRVSIGGLNDGTFRWMEAVESGHSQAWPWLSAVLVD